MKFDQLPNNHKLSSKTLMAELASVWPEGLWDAQHQGICSLPGHAGLGVSPGLGGKSYVSISCPGVSWTQVVREVSRHGTQAETLKSGTVSFGAKADDADQGRLF